MTACMMPSEYGSETLLGSSPAHSSAFLSSSPGMGSGTSSGFFTDFPRCSIAQRMELSSHMSLNIITPSSSLFPDTDSKRSYSRTGSFRRSKKLDKYRIYPVDKELPPLFSNPSKSILRISTCEELTEELQLDNDFPLLSPTKDKKKVCFADALGRQLAQIKLITERPDCPPGWSSAFQDKLIGGVQETPISNWKLGFCQPAADYLKFKEKLEGDSVALENAFVDAENSVLKGVIKVHNLSFHKQVSVLHSENNWKTTSEIDCTYIETPSTVSYDLYDRFSFEIPLPTCGSTNKIYFCIRYRCGGLEYWDNNSSRNYKLSLASSTDSKQQKPTDAYSLTMDNWTNFASWHDLGNDSAPYY